MIKRHRQFLAERVKFLEEEIKEEKGVEEEEASPNKANAQGRGVGRSRVSGAWVVSHPVYASRFNSRRTRSRSATRTPAARGRRRTSTVLARTSSLSKPRVREFAVSVSVNAPILLGKKPVNRASAGEQLHILPTPSVRLGQLQAQWPAFVVFVRVTVITRHSTYSKQTSSRRNPTRVEPVRNPALGQRRARELLQRRRRDD